MIIAIDGPAASGKGTLARRVAAAMDYAYLDTGLLYRATGAKVLALGLDPSNEDAAVGVAEKLGADDLESEELRSEEVGSAASKVAAIPKVRAVLLAFQRNLASSPPDGKRGAVLDGRDIGTVVCPDAPIKFYLTASVEERANRRFKQLQEKNPAAIYERVLKELEERDARDSARDVAPLKMASDAIHIDTDRLNADAVFNAVMAHIRTHMGEND
ncbi:cytidylate kinase [Thalassospira sp. MBR-102]|jgi:cytidylate kinase|uniref:Cytidylate kinase n=1 Tax=Thalassospira xiamenensis TaxID=220697 RepID=A0ABR5XYG4_9PROT|nr:MULTISPECIES: (d)CMP kinase [Thalassospira]KZD01570.1 cytidylate kinase [Thalassospira xiamenensis]KZD11051.1 cytidylate kinase [Thalassospira xiamenensis]MAB32785.1 (d)CMP kinase [Thalassospira sp.]MAL28230.1 (d)CMP kinase [Thalassospira sp.]MBA06288.1 (d)CMP kinase [Thalassospira sp.]|tara:strand:- start:1449 stop:2093 length:645 start_codon:yes stop_codon:yes gene_type:complete